MRVGLPLRHRRSQPCQLDADYGGLISTWRMGIGRSGPLRIASCSSIVIFVDRDMGTGSMFLARYTGTISEGFCEARSG